MKKYENRKMKQARKTVIFAALGAALLLGGINGGILALASEGAFAESAGGDQAAFEYEVQELDSRRDDYRIYGEIYLPRGAGENLPTVVFSHGLGGDIDSGTSYAEALAQAGYVVYCFEFCGGGGSMSDGSSLDMSMLTEQADLEAVIGTLKEQDYVDSEHIFLMGASQGGAVSAITAAANRDEVAGAVLLYPAFVLVDDVKEMFESLEDIPESYSFLWMTVGCRYAADILDYDIYEAISGYDKDVLIIHGDNDGIVPLSYSERAAEVLPLAVLSVIPGAGHGFYGEEEETAVAYTLEYLGSHLD